MLESGLLSFAIGILARVGNRRGPPANRKAMPVEPAPAVVLTAIREKLRRYYSLNSGECDALALGFVVCNLVADLVDGCQVLINAGLAPHAGADSFLNNMRQQLINTVPTDHPWRQVNLLITTEAVGRYLGMAPPTPATTDARQIFNGILARQVNPVRPNPLPQVCRTRNSLVQASFDRWWQHAASGLTPCITRNVGLWAPGPHDLLGAQISAALGPPTFLAVVEFTRHKNNQLAHCLSQTSKEVGIPPVAREWFDATSGRFLGALAMGVGLALRGIDAENLVALLQWIDASGFGNQVGQSGLHQTILWTNSRPFANGVADFIYFPADDIPQVLQEWTDGDGGMRRRLASPDWVSGWMVHDLFRHPLSFDSFGDWRRFIAQYLP